jgi:hypothetical protein
MNPNAGVAPGFGWRLNTLAANQPGAIWNKPASTILIVEILF